MRREWAKKWSGQSINAHFRVQVLNCSRSKIRSRSAQVPTQDVPGKFRLAADRVLNEAEIE